MRGDLNLNEKNGSVILQLEIKGSKLVLQTQTLLCAHTFILVYVFYIFFCDSILGDKMPHKSSTESK